MPALAPPLSSEEGVDVDDDRAEAVDPRVKVAGTADAVVLDPVAVAEERVTPVTLDWVAVLYTPSVGIVYPALA